MSRLKISRNVHKDAKLHHSKVCYDLDDHPTSRVTRNMDYGRHIRRSVLLHSQGTRHIFCITLNTKTGEFVTRKQVNVYWLQVWNFKFASKRLLAYFLPVYVYLPGVHIYHFSCACKPVNENIWFTSLQNLVYLFTSLRYLKIWKPG